MLDTQTPRFRLIGVLPKVIHQERAKLMWPAFAAILNVLLENTTHTKTGLRTKSSLDPLCSLLQCDRNEAEYIIREAFFL